MKDRVAALFVPLLTVVVLLYQVLSDLQIALMHRTTLVIVGISLAAAIVAGALAAFGPSPVRVAVLALCTLLFLDVTFRLSGLFSGLVPEKRVATARDEKRIRDIQQIKAALDRYVQRVGPIPTPPQYGEGTGPESFWGNSWDLSAHDGDRDKRLFLDFLVEERILPSVPTDPVNVGAKDGDPRGGQQYAFFVVPAGYDYAGGACNPSPNRWNYLLAITDLESETVRPPAKYRGSGCACLWKDQPKFFDRFFDYIVCGSFETTPQLVAREREKWQKRAAAAQAKEQEAELAAKLAALKQYVPQDQRRVADLHRIQEGLQRFIKTYGALPMPAEYGEAELASAPGFWQTYWDLSTEDGNGDGRKFLDFLVDTGTMRSVPVDPENVPAPNSDPKGGRQYVYYLVPPGEAFAGGTCAKDRWTYMLAVTELRSEITRPPRNIKGSGCECLWRDAPNFFQKQFDYVICGTFRATQASRTRVVERFRPRAIAAADLRGRVAAERAAREAAALLAKQAAAARVYIPQDRRRVADLKQIQEGLERYLREIGPLPVPTDYGESERARSSGFWQQYWDVSGEDGDRDGRAFLDFLSESGIMPSVPIDPDNERGPDGDPRGGRQYVYFVTSASESFGGGTCATRPEERVYMLGITDLRSEVTRPPRRFTGSGCDCLWRDAPNYFQKHFDYVVCGTFETSPERRARAAEILKQRAAAAAPKPQEPADRAAGSPLFRRDDERRIADLKQIQQALEQYAKRFGRLPAPPQYGESERSAVGGFWQYEWDVSGEDGDGDGRKFLDFLSERGILRSVPLDPDNEPSPDGDPRGGRQYVYFLVAPANDYAGGSCASASKGWVYMLGVTDLRSEIARPPQNLAGSGCECLWRDRPNFFQSQFDYILCGTVKP